jgi:hypothetical protein
LTETCLRLPPEAAHEARAISVVSRGAVDRGGFAAADEDRDSQFRPFPKRFAHAALQLW